MLTKSVMMAIKHKMIIEHCNDLVNHTKLGINWSTDDWSTDDYRNCLPIANATGPQDHLSSYSSCLLHLGIKPSPNNDVIQSINQSFILGNAKSLGLGDD